MLERLGVGHGGHVAGERKLAVRVQHLRAAKVLEQPRQLRLVLGHRQLAAAQVARHLVVVARVAVPRKVEDDVGVGERAHDGGAARRRRARRARLGHLHEELEQQPRDAHRPLGELIGVQHVDRAAVAREREAAHLAQDCKEVDLEVAGVARLLRAHVPRVARVVHQQVAVEVERDGPRAHAVQRVRRVAELVDLAPEAVDHAAHGRGVGAHVVPLVVLDVPVVAVAALEQQEGHKLVERVGAVDKGERRLERVVVDERVVAEDLEGGEVAVDAARHEHAMVRHEGQQLLVEHVLAVVEHILQHVDPLEHRAEELRDGVVVGVALVKVALGRKEQQRREAVRVRVERHPLALHHLAVQKEARPARLGRLAAAIAKRVLRHARRVRRRRRRRRIRAAAGCAALSGDLAPQSRDSPRGSEVGARAERLGDVSRSLAIDAVLMRCWFATTPDPPSCPLSPAGPPPDGGRTAVLYTYSRL